MTDHYQTLGVAKNATPDEIKKAYRRLAAIHHPDKGGDTAEFQKVQAAYETLSDPQKKQEYDNPNPFGQGGHPFSAQGGFPGGFHFSMNGFDMNDIFGQMFGQQRPHSGRPQQPSLQPNSTGETVKITIPKGVENGQTLRFDNLIKDSILLVDFRVHQHHKFDRNGFDLYTIEEVSVLDLIVGTTIKFTTLGGKNLDVTVPPKTQPGSTLRIAKEGLPFQNGHGDQFIVLKPVMPAIIDSRIINAINQSKGN